MHHIAFARHCRTAWNAMYKIAGQEDIPLSAEGRDQAIALGQKLRDSREVRITHIVTSDLSRATESAQLVAHTIGIDQVLIHMDPRFREVQYGELQGRTIPEIISEYGQQVLRPPFDFTSFGGESYDQVVLRLQAGVRDAMRFSDPGTDCATVLIMSHAWSLEAFFWSFLGEKVQLANAEYRVLDLPMSLIP